MNCTCSNMSCESVFCLHLPSVVGMFLSRPTETGPNSQKNDEWSDREECQEFQLLVVQLLRSQTCGRGRWRRRRQVSPRWVKEPPACSRIDCIVVFFNSFELLFFSLSYSLASRNGSIFLLGPCLTVAANHPDSILESNVLSFEFSQLFLRRGN